MPKRVPDIQYLNMIVVNLEEASLLVEEKHIRTTSLSLKLSLKGHFPQVICAVNPRTVSKEQCLHLSHEETKSEKVHMTFPRLHE